MTDELNKSTIKIVEMSLKANSRDSIYSLFDGISFCAVAGEKCWIVESKARHKRMFLQVIAGVLPISEGSIQVTGSIIPGLSPFFGIIPQGSLRQNANLRAIILGYTGDKKNAFVTSIFNEDYIKECQDVAFSEVNSDVRVLYLLQLMKYYHPEIFLVESWVSSTEPDIQLECIKVFQDIVKDSCITISAVENLRLMDGADVRKIKIESMRIEG